MNALFSVRLSNLVMAAVAFAAIHAGFQWLRAGSADWVLATGSGPLFAIGCATLSLTRRDPVPTYQIPQRWEPPPPPAFARGPEEEPLSSMGAGGRFGHFSERARRALTQAQQEAHRFHHTDVSADHLLLGVLSEPDTGAAAVLLNLGVDPAGVCAAVQFCVERRHRGVTQEVSLAPDAGRVLELAVDEARRLRHRYIGTEHLLLGLAREDLGATAGVLRRFGLSLNRLRLETARVRSGD